MENKKRSLDSLEECNKKIKPNHEKVIDQEIFKFIPREIWQNHILQYIRDEKIRKLILTTCKEMYRLCWEGGFKLSFDGKRKYMSYIYALAIDNPHLIPKLLHYHGLPTGLSYTKLAHRLFIKRYYMIDNINTILYITSRIENPSTFNYLKLLVSAIEDKKLEIFLTLLDTYSEKLRVYKKHKNFLLLQSVSESSLVIDVETVKRVINLPGITETRKICCFVSACQSSNVTAVCTFLKEGILAYEGLVLLFNIIETIYESVPESEFLEKYNSRSNDIKTYNHELRTYICILEILNADILSQKYPYHKQIISCIRRGYLNLFKKMIELDKVACFQSCMNLYYICLILSNQLTLNGKFATENLEMLKIICNTNDDKFIITESFITSITKNQPKVLQLKEFLEVIVNSPHLSSLIDKSELKKMLLL